MRIIPFISDNKSLLKLNVKVLQSFILSAVPYQYLSIVPCGFIRMLMFESGLA
jgi:hypothetical protein